MRQVVVAGVLTHCSLTVHTSCFQAIRALRPLLDENVLIRTADSLGDILEVRVRGYGGRDWDYWARQQVQR